MTHHAQGARLLADGNEILAAVLDAINNAHTSIDWHVIVFHPDEIGMEIARALAAAAQRGVSVRLSFNRHQSVYGSIIGSYPPATRDAYLRNEAERWQLFHKAGVIFLDSQFRWRFPPAPQHDPHGWTQWRRDMLRNMHMPLNHYDHRKLLIIDGVTAFVGTGNIGKQYLYHHPVDNDADMQVQSQSDEQEPWDKWLDVMVCLEGGSVVEALTLDFERHWWFLGGEPRTIAQSNSLGTIPVAPLFQTPAQPDNRDRLLRSMEQATTSIHVMCPYITSEAFLTTLARAAQRGVDVDIIYPDKHNDEPVTVQIFRTYIHSLQQAGVSIYACNRRMIHTKMTIVDDRDVFVGSYNLNNRSARHDFELSVVLELPQAHIVMARYRHISDLLPPQRTQQRSLWLRLIQPYT